MPVTVLLPALDQRGESRHASLELRVPSEAARESEGDAHERLGGAFRVVPLLRVLNAGEGRLVVAGRLRVSVQRGDVVVEGVVHTLLSEGDELSGWHHVPSQPELDHLLAPQLMSTGHRVPREDDETVAMVVAKAVAEGSRNAVADLREVRYELEASLARSLRPEAEDDALTVLRALLELSITVNRARDEARAAVREGLWLWLSDGEAYQRHRRRLDPTIISAHAPADADTRPWMSTYDAGVRQSAKMDEQLTEEASHIAGLLDAATTVATQREARAQETLNAVAAAAALGLGLPALILTLYGTGTLVPLKSVAQLPALLLIPLAAAALPFLAARHAPPSQRTTWKKMSGMGVLGFMVVLAVAIVFAP